MCGFVGTGSTPPEVLLCGLEQCTGGRGFQAGDCSGEECGCWGPDRTEKTIMQGCPEDGIPRRQRLGKAAPADGLSGLSLAALFWALNSGESVHWGASAIYKIPW